jgi:hypothetical protein
MFKVNKKDQIVVDDERALDEWLSFKTKNLNMLDMDNKVVRKVIAKFGDKGRSKVYHTCRQLYWLNFDTEQEFFDAVDRYLPESDSLDEFEKLMAQGNLLSH